MSRLTLRLPETLHQQLVNLALGEGVSLNQYIVYALTRQVASPYTVQATSEMVRAQQEQSFEALLENLGQASTEQSEAILAQREQVEPEPGLNTDVVNRLRARIRQSEPQNR